MLETFSWVFEAGRHDRARECFPSGPVFAQALAAVACILASASLPFFLIRMRGTLTPAEYRPSSTAVSRHPGPAQRQTRSGSWIVARFGAGTMGKEITDALQARAGGGGLSAAVACKGPDAGDRDAGRAPGAHGLRASTARISLAVLRPRPNGNRVRDVHVSVRLLRRGLCPGEAIAVTAVIIASRVSAGGGCGSSRCGTNSRLC